MHYTYLLINLATIIFPFLFSFDKKVAFFKDWRHVFFAISCTALIFIGWDIYFTKNGIWSFNSNYIIGLKIFDLPFEEILFFITVPYACLFIYRCLETYFNFSPGGLSPKLLLLVLAIFLIVLSIIYFSKIYTMVNFILSAILILIFAFGARAKKYTLFFAIYFLQIIPFLLVNGLLTSLPVVLYNPAHITGFRIYSIPIEDTMYSLSLLLLNILLFEYFRGRQCRKPFAFVN